MQNSSTMRVRGSRIFKGGQLTIGMDLGDRSIAATFWMKWEHYSGAFSAHDNEGYERDPTDLRIAAHAPRRSTQSFKTLGSTPTLSCITSTFDGGLNPTEFIPRQGGNICQL